MTVQDLLAPFSHIRLAGREDNQIILDFFKRISMKGDRLSIGFRRDPDYFSLLDYQGDKSFVFLFENEDRSLGGVAVYGLSRKFVNGRLERAAYLADLRLAPDLSRSTRMQWRQFLNDIVLHSQEIEEFEGCRFMYSAILDENKAAIRAFTKKKSNVIFRPMSHYNTISILMRSPVWPTRLRKRSGFHVRRARVEDRAKVHAFLAYQNHDRPLGAGFRESAGDELERRFETWKNFSIDQFILAESAAGEIVGCMCPWSDTEARAVFVENMSSSTKALAKVLEFAGKEKVEENHPIHILYLTHLEVDLGLESVQRQAIFADLLEHVFQLGLHKQHHVISFVDYDQASLQGAIQRRGYLYWKTPCTIYQVLHRDRYRKSNLIRSTRTKPPSFEIAVL